MSLTLRNKLDAQAKLGDGQRCMDLYEAYQNESGKQAAIDWLEEALDSNSSSAQYIAGILDLNEGRIEEGLSFLTLSATNDNAQAMNVLGQLYLSNVVGLECIEFDLEKGMDYLIQAGRHGCVEAQLILGKCFYLGQWVHKDNLMSSLWLEKAADQGSRDAQKLLDEILMTSVVLN
ncbi:sel1 repeat family protein [Erysipelotrichaceae bacterium RD49]|nr:sel1 repeat family protein [Erysipelotrichaceae bacterium RD49]